MTRYLRRVIYTRKLKKLLMLRPDREASISLAIYLLESKQSKLLQKALLRAGAKITVDGLVGNRTLNALERVNEDRFLTEAGRLTSMGRTTASRRSKILMEHLAKYEGTHLHYNKGEKGFTSMYGVYSYVNKSSRPIRYINDLARTHGLYPISRNNVKRMDRKLNQTDRDYLFDIIFDFYLDKYSHPKANELLDDKTWLSFMSISINGGLSRAIRCLHKAVYLKPSKHWTRTLTEDIPKYNESILNRNLLDAMQSHYDYLIAKNPRKYLRYKRGWKNRLDALR